MATHALSADAQLFFTQAGEPGAPAAVLLHTWAADSHDWSWTLPALAPHVRAVTVDLRGHGRSSAPAAGYSVHELAGDVAALVRALGLPPAVFLGHGVGAAVASVLAVEQPGLVRALVTVDGTYGYGTEMEPELRGLAEALAGPEPYRVAQGLYEGAFHGPALAPALRTWHARRIEATPAHVLRQGFEGFALAPGSFILRPRAEAYLVQRRCPVLAFRTHADSSAWERAHAPHPDSASVLFDGARHFLHQEQPDAFNRALLEWLLPRLSA